MNAFTVYRAAAMACLVAPLASAASSLPRSTPEEQGISAEAISDFVRTADKKVDAMNSFILVRHGHVVAEGWWTPYTAESPHTLYSLSKSFTATAVGLAASEGKLSVDDEVLKFFPEDAPSNPTAYLKSMRVSDLLRMSTGHQLEPRFNDRTDERWTKIFLAHPVPFKPGTHFVYNTAATYMQSAIVQKVTGETVLDYLKPRLFEPLGIENPRWGMSPQGVSFGGYGLDVRTEDIAKFGQLYLQKGNWNGKQLIPAAWVEAATAAANFQWKQPEQRLGSRIRLSVLAISPWSLPRRWCVWAILHCDAGAGRCPGDYERHPRYVGRAKYRLGEAAGRDEERFVAGEPGGD